MIYAAIILLIAAVIYCHKRDWKENKLTGRVNHSKALKWKIITSLPAGILLLIYLTGVPLLLEWITLWASVKSILLTGTWFLFLFNSLWGYRAAKDIFYRSTATGKEISRWDRFVLHWPRKLYILFIGCLVTGATLIYFL